MHARTGVDGRTEYAQEVEAAQQQLEDLRRESQEIERDLQVGVAI